MLQTLSYIINVAPEGVPQVVKLSQNENGRTLAFTLTGAGTVNIPSGSTVTISGTKPDGVVYSQTGTISGTTASFPETTQMTAVAGIWPAKIKVTYNGETIATCKIVMAIDPDPVAPGSVPSSSQLNGLVAEAQQYATYAKYEAFGSPLVAATAAAMTDKTRVYVYTGSETGKTAGHWYYWNGSAWTDGGVYNSQGINTDTTLTLSGMAADAKAVGDEFTHVKQDNNYITGNEKITAVNGAYINLSAGVGGTANINAPTPSEGSAYAVANCSQADIFTLTTKGGNSGRAYGFLESDGTIISVAPAQAVYNERVLIAPNGSAYFVANSNQADLIAYKGVLVRNSIEDLDNAIDADSKVFEKFIGITPTFTSGKFVTENGTIGNDPTSSATLDYIHILKGSSIYVRSYCTFVVAKSSLPTNDGFYDWHMYDVKQNALIKFDSDCYIRMSTNNTDIENNIMFLLYDTSIEELTWDGLNGYGFELGALNASTGNLLSRTDRMRTGFVNALKGSKVHLSKSNYTYTVFEYYTDSAFYYSGNNADTVWTKEDYEVTNQDVAYIKIVVKRDDGATMGDADISYLREHLYIRAISQKASEISIEGIPNGVFYTENVAFDGATDLTYSEIINGYDALLSTYPNYIQKNTLGTDSSGNYTIYQYVFTPNATPKLTLNYTGKDYNDSNSHLPTIILEAGVHGSERPITRGLLNFMTALCNNWQDDEFLSFLRFNFRFVVNPCAVPWGYENISRYNYNGVNINRNFDGMGQWQYGSDVVGNPNYRGPSPLSEVESQYINNTLTSFKDDAILYFSYHTYGLMDAYTRMMCWAWATYVKPNEMFIAGENVLKKISRNAWGKHNYPVNDATNPICIGSMQAFNTSDYKGGYTANQGNSYGIPSACPEGIYYKYGQSDTRNSHDINCLNMEYIVITIIEALKQLY